MQQPPPPPPPTSGAGGGSGPTEPPKKRSRLPIFAGLAVLVAAAIVVIVLVSGGSSTPAGQPFDAAAQPVPTNRVTGDGTATLHLNGDDASVTVDTNGLLNGQPHAMHIHAGGKGVCPPASAARLAQRAPDDQHHQRDRLLRAAAGGADHDAATRAVKSIVDFSRYPARRATSATRGRSPSHRASPRRSAPATR